ncbi:MAG TPA: serine/threonine-protein kinase [Pirellulales bacterium]|jgi:hypothetical protein|nr:serine/threonine-protein kinase [Pirellulales bacterium]
MTMHADPFRDLLDRWEELHQAGAEPDIVELCRDCPEYAERLRDWARTLKLTDWLNQPAAEAASDTLGDLPSARRAALIPPPQVGEYELHEELGSGGMGRVYRAVHRKLLRPVAVKILSPADKPSAESIERFQREAKVLAKLSHPNIVTIHDAGIAAGTHYFVMELVDGKDLASVVKADGPLPVDCALDCIRQVAEGLRYAHAAGIVHRDIKPSNLMLDAEGKVQILDLGIARAEAIDGPASELTRTGAILGTVDYMPPEQALNTRKADQRADVYSLGCTLYFLLTGQPLYEGETVMERLVAHREQPIPSLRKACPSVPGWLEQVFPRLVAKRPADRLATMDDVLAALRLHAAPPRPVRRRAALVAGVVLLALLPLGFWLQHLLFVATDHAAWRQVGKIPVIAGVWKQWDGIFLTITQQGENFQADCEFGQPGVQVRWRAAGKITPDGRMEAALIHTEPPRPEPAKPQICTAILQPDGTTIRGHAAWTTGGGDFTWRLNEPRPPTPPAP